LFVESDARSHESKEKAMNNKAMQRRALRNPVAMPARQRRAGAHGASRKAQRQHDRQALQRALSATDALP
jgi:hypothetical protein